MNTPIHFAIRGLAAVTAVGLASLAQAGDGSYGPRKEVDALVLTARVAHELRPAGEAVEPPATPRGPDRTRGDVRAEVLAARTAGRLIAAGEASPSGAPTAPSTLARSDVKNETLIARMHGELLAAGEGLRPVDRAAQPLAHRAVLAASGRR